MKRNGHKKIKNKTIDIVDRFPDRSVSCPICRQEFWGYSEIIFCSCGWTYVQEKDLSNQGLKKLTDQDFTSDYNLPYREIEITGKLINFNNLRITSKDD